MTTEEKLDRLTNIVDALATTVVAHDNQIEQLIAIGERHEATMKELAEESRNLQRQWQAYIDTLPKH